MDQRDHACAHDRLEGSPVLSEVLGQALEPLKLFHDKLETEGIERGIIGPRDAGIVWERHILNSAAIVPFVVDSCRDAGSRRVADLGSGGGFPGLILAACLPDYQLTLIEPMERRVIWLRECIEMMGLGNVEVLRDRAENLAPSAAGRGGSEQGRRKRAKTVGKQSRTGSMPAIKPPQPFAVVSCRAVAPLTKLASWALPLVQTGGRLVALKGRSAQAEIDKALKELRKRGGRNPRAEEAQVGPGLEPTHVVLVDKI
ncbi:16S rRNA (guanine(527)-N(7))-methyltransferase RsmG [Bifidobacterium xylocopae]|uniref:Ribosomal RNA small subunit methyltransferase G n=1 Tax=Bifidobacterium xylocopae TaxID=2493119 RepID=A0A366KDD2_9BIFI|nr:16S rRNA (guanine(527)-N(7))-methyltransferase RsmG [Bifidobacterium xylocopae]RBP99714.1 16S rRNA (guanine(527)-N(7))-methyltransferase RsmG [Bifidobacterium xylocopae]